MVCQVYARDFSGDQIKIVKILWKDFHFSTIFSRYYTFRFSFLFVFVEISVNNFSSLKNFKRHLEQYFVERIEIEKFLSRLC